MKRVALLSTVLLLIPGWSFGQSVALVADGVAAAALVLPDHPSPDEVLAARELQTHIERMSGARLEIVDRAPPGSVPVRIGASLDQNIADLVKVRSDDPAAFIVECGEKGISVVGNSPEGTLFAAYQLLEELGVRWYLPGELGTVIPQTASVSLPVHRIFQAPSFSHRHLQNVGGDAPWSRRQRLGGLHFPSSHGLRLDPSPDFDTEPELFALVNGKRQDSQYCVSNPEIVRRAITRALQYFGENPDSPWLGMGPNDTGGYCECEQCRTLDTGEIDPISGRAIRTDRYVWLFNQILEAVHEQFPGKKVAFYAYDSLKFPPRSQPVSPYLVPAFAPITHDRIHGLSNPLSPDRSAYRTVMEQWCAVVPEAFERGYYFNLACPGLPFSKIHAVRDETPVAHSLGVKGWRVETKPSWASNGLTLYVAARLMWNVETDVDALLAELYEKLFGPAADPMGRYLDTVDASFRDTECFTGSSFCFPHVFPPERVAQCRHLLDAAADKASASPVHAERVRIFRLNHERLEAFLGMLVERNSFDFGTAQQHLDRLIALTDTMLNYRLYPEPSGSVSQPPDRQGRGFVNEARLLYPGVAPSYIHRFWSPCTEAGYERAVLHGEVAATTPDTWSFLIDPSNAGEFLGWYRDGRIGGHWQPMRTKTASWSDQGLHYYKGLAWYRVETSIPERFRGRRIFLWFGGIDERAEVWVNGQLVGTSDEPGRGLPPMAGTFKPFDLEVTDAARFGEPSSVAVRITNKRLNELGTGGITAPVMFWSPKSDQDLEAVFPTQGEGAPD